MRSDLGAERLHSAEQIAAPLREAKDGAEIDHRRRWIIGSRGERCSDTRQLLVIAAQLAETRLRGQDQILDSVRQGGWGRQARELEDRRRRQGPGAVAQAGELSVRG